MLANALALSGMKPYVTIYSTFLQRGYDQVNHDIARMGGDVVVGIDRCGVIGEDGVSHQGIFDVSLLLPIPGITLAQGKDAAESARLLATGFATDVPTCCGTAKTPCRSRRFAPNRCRWGAGSGCIRAR